VRQSPSDTLSIIPPWDPPKRGDCLPAACLLTQVRQGAPAQAGFNIHASQRLTSAAIENSCFGFRRLPESVIAIPQLPRKVASAYAGWREWQSHSYYYCFSIPGFFLNKEITTPSLARKDNKNK
jgi:hypothetical protein